VNGKDAEDGERAEDRSGYAQDNEDAGERLPDQVCADMDGPEDQSLPDLGALLSRLGEVQQNLQHAQETAAAKVLEGSAGGGAVRVRATGGLEFEAVIIDPSAVDPDDVDLLQDLILAALRDVVEQAHTEAAQALGGIDLGGGLGGLLGR
jgi:DNA-binding YbaB/EbfC family protein